MNEKNLTVKQKKAIFIVGISAIFLGATLCSFIDPYNKSGGFGSIISMSLTIIGLCIGFLIQEKTKLFKTITFCIGIGIILSTWWFLSLSDVGKLLGLYIGGFLAGTMLSKSNLIAKTFDNKKEESVKKKEK